MGVFAGPEINEDRLVLALDGGNTKSFVDLPVQGQQAYTTPGTYSWTAPVGVTSVCVVCIGAGGCGGAYGGGGGSLAYKNNISVTPGQSYSIEVGAANTDFSSNSLVTTNAGLSSAFGTYAFGGRGGNIGGNNTQGIGGNYDGGGEGGNGSTDFYQSGIGYKSGAGGGAGGYSGDGGNAGIGTNTGSDGSGGGGGGGSTGSAADSHGGGGVGIYGEGANGSGGVAVYNGGSGNGGGGSGGEDGALRGIGSTVSGGGLYGGGGGGGTNAVPVTTGSNSGGGAVRIIWGSGRSFPSTNTVDVTPQAGSFNWGDISGKGNDGTLTNGPTYSSDDGGYFTFDGTNDQIDCGSSDNFAFGTGDFTIEFWCNPDTIGTKAIISISATGSSVTTNWQIRYNSSKVRWLYSGSSDIISNSTVSAGEWTHVVATRSGTALTLYINTVSEATGTSSANLSETGVLRIGCTRAQSGYFDGKISNVKLYKGKALTAEEVTQNYNALKKRYGI